MKSIFVILIICLSISCDKTSVQGVNLIGNWELTSHTDPDVESGIIYEFKRDDKLIIRDNEYSDTLEYKLLYNNSIHISYESIDDVYDIKTHSDDLIEIMGFSITAITEEMNTLLKRNSE